jgi:hypothetical protein
MSVMTMPQVSDAYVRRVFPEISSFSLVPTGSQKSHGEPFFQNNETAKLNFQKIFEYPGVE